MARKGYASEYKAKQELVSEFGINSVFKLAIGQAADYLVFKGGRLIKVVEVKECHQKTYYPTLRDTAQFERILSIAEANRCSAERWVNNPQKGKTLPWAKQIVNF